jgi:hypothetical protein
MSVADDAIFTVLLAAASGQQGSMAACRPAIHSETNMISDETQNARTESQAD